MRDIMVFILILVAAVLSGCSGTSDTAGDTDVSGYELQSTGLDINNSVSIGIGENIELNEKLPGFMLYGLELQIVKSLDKFNYSGANFTFTDSEYGNEMTLEFFEAEYIKKVSLDKGVRYQDKHGNFITLIDMDGDGVIDRYLLEHAGCTGTMTIDEANGDKVLDLVDCEYEGGVQGENRE